MNLLDGLQGPSYKRAIMPLTTLAVLRVDLGALPSTAVEKAIALQRGTKNQHRALLALLACATTSDGTLTITVPSTPQFDRIVSTSDGSHRIA
jgi:hypothetical protein